MLAGRNPDRLEALAVELGGLPTALADVERPGTLRGLLHEGDVLVTLVGPFMTGGDPALRTTLPRFAPQVQAVNVALGWFGPLSRALRAGTAANAMLTGVPGMRGLSRRVTAPLAERTGGGPDEQARKRLGSQILAIARDTWERELATVRLEGPNPYTFTVTCWPGAPGRLAWGAWQAATNGVKSTGAQGPIDAFGLDALRAACTEIGLVRADDGSRRP